MTIHVANCTNQLHRVFMPDRRRVDVPPGEQLSVPGDAAAAYAAHVRFGAVHVGHLVGPAPPRICLLFSDEPIDPGLISAVAARNVGAMAFVPSALHEARPPFLTPAQEAEAMEALHEHEPVEAEPVEAEPVEPEPAEAEPAETENIADTPAPVEAEVSVEPEAPMPRMRRGRS
jgi:hypothetical protein